MCTEKQNSATEDKPTYSEMKSQRSKTDPLEQKLVQKRLEIEDPYSHPHPYHTLTHTHTPIPTPGKVLSCCQVVIVFP